MIQNFLNVLYVLTCHPSNHNGGTERMDAEKQRWLEKAGLLFEEDGVPRTAGMILASLLLSPEACSLDDMAGSLGVSKAGVSTNARLLEQLGAIEREMRPGDRRDYYRLPPDLHMRMLEHWLIGFRKMKALVEQGLTVGVAGDEVVRARMRTSQVFFTHMLEEIEGARERWLRDHAEEREPALSGASGGEA